jgi:6-pyruvoyltetrahydropterin/6-carboxytetrahydropterin synthase
MLTVTKRFEFCYGHNLPEYEGKCKNFHGHNSILEVELRGPNNEPEWELFYAREDRYPGMLVDFGTIKELVGPLVEYLDHKNLNEVLHENFLPPTAENLCNFFWKEISDALEVLNRFKGLAFLYRIRVYETPNSYAEIKELL